VVTVDDRQMSERLQECMGPGELRLGRDPMESSGNVNQVEGGRGKLSLFEGGIDDIDTWKRPKLVASDARHLPA
jgi:hypothetical protein